MVGEPQPRGEPSHGADKPGPSSGVAGDQPPGVGFRAFATIWLALFLDLFGFGIVIPVLPYYATHFGASPSLVTMLATAFSLAQFVMSPVLGRLSDTYGRRPVMLVSIGGSCVAMVVLGFSSALWMVFLARVVSGACNANVSTANAYVADRVPPEQRARYMGMMGSAIGLGFVFGPAVGGLLSIEGHPEAPFLAAAGLAAVNWVMAWRWLPESHARRDLPARKLATPWQTLQRLFGLGPSPLRLLATISFGFFFAFSAMESTFALLTKARLGWGEKETGVLFSLIGVCIVLAQTVLLSRLVAAFGEKRTLTIGLWIQGLGLVAVGLAYGTVVLAVGAAMLATGNGLVNPSTSALVSRISSAEEQGLNQGIVQSAAAVARIVGPIIGGFLFEYVWEGAPFLLGAAMAVAVVMLFARRIAVTA